MLKRLLLVFLSALCLSTNVSAWSVSDDLFNFYNESGIYYYNPEGANCQSTLGAYDGVTTAGLSASQAAFVDQYHELAEQLSTQYGIPWEAVMAQGIIESGAGTSTYARERNNFFGLGAVDSNPDNAYYYPTPTMGWVGYYEFITNNPRYRNHGVFQGDTITNPYAYVQAIKSAGYATDSYYVQKVSNVIRAIENRATEKGWQSSAQLAQSNPEMLANASSSAAGEFISTSYDGCITYAGNTPGSATLDSTGCVTYGNGNINDTAINLSWADRNHSTNQPNNCYANALQVVRLTSYGDANVQQGSSCDAFVTAVMRFSGADPDFYCCGTTAQLNYLTSHPEKYLEIPNLGNQSNMQPGDIRIRPGHIEMYVQLPDGSTRIASASYGERTGDHYDPYYVGSSAYRIFRRIN